jgi:hypothetical protein
MPISSCLAFLIVQGAQKISPFPSVEDLICRLLTLTCDQKDPERAFVKFNKNDDTVLLINNYGGLSNLELGVLMQETLAQLGKISNRARSYNILIPIRKELGYQAHENLLGNI